MHSRFEPAGQVLILSRHGQGHLQRQGQREDLVAVVDGAKFDGRLKVVDGTHGVSPY
jgi:hypothetical protein